MYPNQVYYNTYKSTQKTKNYFCRNSMQCNNHIINYFFGASAFLSFTLSPEFKSLETVV